MSRSRKDDSRYQPPSGHGLQSSHSRDPHSGASAFHTSVSGHNYMRSKVKDRDRGGYLAKDRPRTANPADPTDRYFASAKHGNFQSPPPNSFPCADGAASAREQLSWADEVELSMSNSGSQRTDANANSGGTPHKMVKSVEQEQMMMKSLDQGQMMKSLDQGQMMKSLDQGQMMKSLDQGQMMKSLDQGVVEFNSAMQSGNANQRPADEKVVKMLPKNTVATAAFSNGKAKVNFDKEHDPAGSKRPSYPQLRRGSRKKTLSLNPEEREALESLIEEVLMDGVIDSESASSEEDAEQSETWKNADTEQGGAGANAGAGGDGTLKVRGDKGKMGRKYYPGQLKVALKHMTELPPRFSRKLKKAEKYLELNTMRAVNSTTGRIEEEDEESVALALARDDNKRMSLSPRPPEQRDKEKAKSKEHQVKEFKRSIRTLLTDLDQYVDEKSVLSNSSSATSIHPPGAIICEDLERESLRQPPPLQTSAEMTHHHEVPSTAVQNLLLAAQGYTGGQATQETYQEQYQESEPVSSGQNLGGYAGAMDHASQRYGGPSSSYAVQDSTTGSQFMVNVPEFVPKGMIVTTHYQPQEMLSPVDHHPHHQYQMTQMSPGGLSAGLNDLNSRHGGGLTTEQMVALGHACQFTNAGTVAAESSGAMMDFSNAMVSLPPALSTPGSSMGGEKMLSPMPPVFVSSGMPMSNLPSPGSLPFYQYQAQNPPPPSNSYSFPVQVPFSTNQYCYMPPALPPQSLPPPYYPRDQYADGGGGGMQYKAPMPDWGYQKPPKHYSSNVSALPSYSAFPNQATVPPSYPGSEQGQGMPGMNSLNFRQRKKQSGSSLSPRNMVNASSLNNMSSGKLGMQRTRGGEGPSALTRVGLRPGQENVDSYLHPEPGMTGTAYGDASMKRFPFTARSRASGDGQPGYPGRRENRNFVSDKYAAPRTFASDGKKETRHVTLKPKQSKPNRSLARSRNDSNVAPMKALHPSDLSEEGLESPDNFGDVESGADDWSTDNYDLEVSKKGREGVVGSHKGGGKDRQDDGEENVPSMGLEEVGVVQSGETAPGAVPGDTSCVSENGLVVFSECVAENNFGAEVVVSQANNLRPEFWVEPSENEPIRSVSEPARIVCEQARSVSEPVRSVSEITIGVGEPAISISEPATSISEPAASINEPVRITSEPARCVREPVRLASETCSTESEVAQQHLSLEMQSDETCVTIATKTSQLQQEVDRNVINTENLKRTAAVWKKIQASLEDLQVAAHCPSSKQDTEHGTPSVGDCAEIDVHGSAPELPAIVCGDGVTSRDGLPAEGSVDIDVPCGDEEAVDEGVYGSELKGMDVMLGSDFISRLMNMFKPNQSTDFLFKRSSKTVHLSQAILNQIYLEYMTQDQDSVDLQNVTSGSLEDEEEDVSNNGPLAEEDVPPEECLQVTFSPSITAERTLDDDATTTTTGYSKLCDISTCHDPIITNDCKSERDVVLNNNIIISDDPPTAPAHSP